MSTYVREKVLRIPTKYLNLETFKNKYPDYDDDFEYYLTKEFPDIFDYGTVGMFQLAPTCESYIDYVLEYEWDADGEYGKTRALYDSEKRKYAEKFKQIDANVDMDKVRLVEFCWYNGCEAPDYYDDSADSFYDEV